MKEFYVYVHWRPDGIPFYVGKGNGCRAFELWNNQNRHYKFIIQKYGKKNIKVIIVPCESEKDALSKEIQWISIFRMLGFKLTNKSNGGEGPTGAVRSEETRKKMSQSKLGNNYTLGLKRGPMPESQRKKLSESKRKSKVVPWNKGIPRTEEVKTKIGDANRKIRALKKAKG